MIIYRQNRMFVEQRGYLIKKYRSNTSTHVHSHDFIEIVFFLHGEGVHVINGKKHSICRGGFYIIDSGQTHNLIISGNTEYYNIFLTVQYLSQFVFADLPGCRNAYDIIGNSDTSENITYFDPEKTQQIETLFNSIYSEFYSKREFSDGFIRTYIQLLLYEFERSKVRCNRQESVHQIIMPKVIDYINDHYNENITIKFLSEKYNYNAAYFGRLFKKNYNISLCGYIKKIRLQRTCELLQTTDYSISDISFQVGFNNKLEFYKAFRDAFDCTPKEYRKREQQNDNILAAVEPDD